MEELAEKKNSTSERTEEVRDIIERMPNTFARNITYLVYFIVALLLFFGYVVKYPDIVTGEVILSAEQSPLQIVAGQSGRLKINHIKSQDMIQPDQLLAWIDNPAQPDLIAQIKTLLTSLPLATTEARLLYNKLPKNLNLGDLTIPYSSLLTTVKQLADYQDHKLYDKHEQSLAKILDEQTKALSTLKDKERLSRASLKISDKYLERDSILLAKRLISQAEYEQSIAGHIGAEDQVKTSLRNSGSVREQISSTENSIQQNKITKSEKEQQFDLELLTAYNNLIDKINLWEKQYLITSPVGGNAQFLKFWTNNQFVQAGEPLFSIVPKQNEVLGKVMLPVQGAGKVKMGQKVIVKMADYPYMEYGYIEGKVNNISLVSSPVNLGNGSTVDSYLVTLIFPEGLMTNYGTQLDFRFEAKGTAEIITKDRRLIERFFDNLKYIGHSK
ncbi:MULTISPECIES: HlyD family efflux transporter periplasmic adaptor subunit [Sphingobacterium]|uniref:HlyD family efflux transporter periplasmic adaptor subunit n=1 Tax=Sphingobacterium kitahiroshimense TaxID=470446 RepID=A0ABV0C062_9SPHI|nr:HlyD family efflux transporter periplasmic adaptor subunit [Sphingobacterium faecium]MQP30241.1 HlyD family efflux transporter periplasmic adaptor subunit [Sphingobacterium faecium]